MKRLGCKINAKLNLSLNVFPKREDGFHPVESVVASLNISDVVILSQRSDRRVFVNMNTHKITEKNTALRVAKLMVRTYDLPGVDIFLHKTIPVMGGLGGSSADAAGTMAALARMYRLPWNETFYSIANQIGSDICYMLKGGFATLSGRGEKVEPFPADVTLPLVMVKPSKGLSSARVYEQFDAMETPPVLLDCSALRQALQAGDMQGIAENIGNSLQDPACVLYPQLCTSIGHLQRLPVRKVWMTGSGSCLFLLCYSVDQSKEIVERLRKFGIYAKYCRTEQNGLTYLEE